MDQKIKQIITYSSDEGTSGYLLSQKQIDQLKSLFLTETLDLIKEAKPIIGEGQMFNAINKGISFYEEQLRTLAKEKLK